MVKTSSGATAVQVVWSWRKGSRSIEHLGWAHDEVELAALKAAAAEWLAAGQTELDLGVAAGHVEPGTLPILSSQMTQLCDAVCAAYRILGFESATKGDNVFRDLILARIIEPTKIDAERVLSEVGAAPAPYATVKRRLRGYGQPRSRQALAAASAAHAGLGPASLVLFDVSTLYFEADAGDGVPRAGILQGTQARTADHL
jgi:hypothetical protein